MSMEVTEDKLLGGRVTLRQPAKGYRVAVDPLLLAAFTGAKAGDKVLELGCGTGAALLCLNARVAGLALSALERDADMLALARENAGLNSADISFYAGEVGGTHTLPFQTFDHVIFNPPFYDDHDASPYQTRNAAHRLDTDLGVWIETARKALKPQGTVSMVLAAHQLGAALAALVDKFGAIRVMPVRPQADKEAARVLISGVVGRKTKLSLLPDLVLHQADGAYTARAEDILRGGMPIENHP